MTCKTVMIKFKNKLYLQLFFDNNVLMINSKKKKTGKMKKKYPNNKNE